MLNQYRLNVSQRNPRPPKGGMGGLLARADPRMHSRTLKRAERAGRGRGDHPAAVQTAAPRRGHSLRRRRCGAGAFAFGATRCNVRGIEPRSAAGQHVQIGSGHGAQRGRQDRPPPGARRAGSRSARRPFPVSLLCVMHSTFCNVFSQSWHFVLSPRKNFFLRAATVCGLFAACFQKISKKSVDRVEPIVLSYNRRQG